MIVREQNEPDEKHAEGRKEANAPGTRAAGGDAQLALEYARAGGDVAQLTELVERKTVPLIPTARRQRARALFASLTHLRLRRDMLPAYASEPIALAGGAHAVFSGDARWLVTCGNYLTRTPARIWDLTATELRQTARRIVTAKKLYNLREGWTPTEDTLPRRFLTEQLPQGSSTGAVLPRERLEAMIAAYYRERGWTAAGTVPDEAARALGLGDLVGDFVSLRAESELQSTE